MQRLVARGRKKDRQTDKQTHTHREREKKKSETGDLVPKWKEEKAKHIHWSVGSYDVCFLLKGKSPPSLRQQDPVDGQGSQGEISLVSPAECYNTVVARNEVTQEERKILFSVNIGNFGCY